MRNRTLMRPMFRIGGSSGTGITSGLDRPGYANGTDPDQRNIRSLLPQLGSLPPETPKKPTGLGLGTIPGFITQFGLDIASRPPSGSIFSTAAASAKEPFGKFQQAKQIEEAYGMKETEEDRALVADLIKGMDDDKLSALMKDVKAGVESGLFANEQEGIKLLLQKKIYGVQYMPGEERKKAIDANAQTIAQNMRVNTLVAKRMATFEYDFDSIQKKNDDLSFDIEDPYWNPGRKTYKEGFTYHDAITGKYFTRDSNAPGGDGVPQGFVEIQINT